MIILAAKGKPDSGSGTTVDLSGSWKKFLTAFEDATQSGRILDLLAIVGLLIVLLAVVKWAWDRRRGGGMGQSGNVWGSLLVGALLAAPKTIIPVFLFILDAIANAVINVWNNSEKPG